MMKLDNCLKRKKENTLFNVRISSCEVGSVWSNKLMSQGPIFVITMLDLAHDDKIMINCMFLSFNAFLCPVNNFLCVYLLRVHSQCGLDVL